MRNRLVAALFVAAGIAVSGLAIAQEMQNPLADAKVGEWARYKMQGGMEMKQTITKVDGKKITIATEMFMNGKSMSKSENVIDLEAKGPAGPAGAQGEKPTIEDATVEVNGKKLACKAMTVGGAKTYTCMDIPVSGLVKTEMGGNVTMEITEWGSDGKAAGGGDGEGGGDAGGAAGAKTATMDDITVTVTDAGPMKTDTGTVVKGFHTFKVSIKNGAGARRTVKGLIKLNDGASGSCTIYAEVETDQTVDKVLNCKETGAWDKWDVVIEKVFKF